MKAGNRGFTLVELVVSLVLGSLVAFAMHGVISAANRFFQELSQRTQVSDRLRTAISAVAGELRELDSSGGDLIAIAPSSVTYRASRSTQFVCQAPSGADSVLTVYRNLSFGLRQVAPGRDSVLVYAERGHARRNDGHWLTSAVTSRTERVCPSGDPGVGLALAGVSGLELSQVPTGAPLRAYQTTRLRLYHDRTGTAWLGLSEWREGSGWSATQPLVGPLEDQGFRLEYVDGLGAATGSPTAVRQVRITVVALGSASGQRIQGALRDSITTLVTLRNRPLP
jgi:prepilin-type N-terminal cleavage/methylation domain-containing protein